MRSNYLLKTVAVIGISILSISKVSAEDITLDFCEANACR